MPRFKRGGSLPKYLKFNFRRRSAEDVICKLDGECGKRVEIHCLYIVALKVVVRFFCAGEGLGGRQEKLFYRFPVEFHTFAAKMQLRRGDKASRVYPPYALGEAHILVFGDKGERKLRYYNMVGDERRQKRIFKGYYIVSVP